MKIIRSLGVQIVALLVFMVGAACASASTGDIAGAPGWHVGYTGYGSVTALNRTLTLRPKVSTRPSETHAALALSDTSYGRPRMRVPQLGRWTGRPSGQRS